MKIQNEVININSNYLERVLDKDTIKNISYFGDVYKKYRVQVIKDTLFDHYLTNTFQLLNALVLNEDLPAIFIGEYLARLMSDTIEGSTIVRYKLNEVSIKSCKRHYADDSPVNQIINTLKLPAVSSSIRNILAKVPPKTICLYQQYNICCYTEEYISKYSIENKMGYGDLANINEEVANIYNYVFNPSTAKTAADRLGEYYLRINDANPDIFLAPVNDLIIVSTIMNYSYNPAFITLFDHLSKSSLKDEVNTRENWEDMSKKYRTFYKLLRENTLSY